MPRTAATERLETQYAFSGPANRWKRAQELSGLAHFSERVKIPLILDAAEYIRLCASGADGRSEGARRFPLVVAAEALDQEAARVQNLKILVLGNSPQVDIAERFELSVAVLDAWERLFFDVRGNQDATSWIQQWVVGRAEKSGDHGWAVKLKTAWSGGPLVAQAIVEADCRVPLSEGQRLFDRTLKFHLKLEEAMNLTFETDEGLRWFLDAGLELKLEERRLKLATEKLQVHSQEALQKHERFLQRAKASERRELRRSERPARQSAKARSRPKDNDREQENRRFEQAQRDVDEQARTGTGCSGSPLPAALAFLDSLGHDGPESRVGWLVRFRRGGFVLFAAGIRELAASRPRTIFGISSGVKVILMKHGSKRNSILGGLLEHCPPYVLGDVWRHFNDKDAFRGPEDAGQAWTALTEAFDVRDLLQAGVAVADTDGKPILNPILCGPDAILVALRSQESQAPFALLTSDGCIPPGNLPAAVTLEACPPERLAAEFDDVLFAAFCIGDVVALRSLGLRATLALGLDTAIGEPLVALATRMGWAQEEHSFAAPRGVFTAKAGSKESVQPAEGAAEEADKDEDDDDSERTAKVVLPRTRELVFVGWSALELRIDPPALLPTVHARFTKMKKYLGFSLDEVNQWSLTQSDREEIEFALQHGRREPVLDAIHSVLEQNAAPFVPDPQSAPAPPMPAPPPDLMSASARFVERVRTRRTGESIESPWSELEGALERELIQPMLKDALITKDPQLKNSKLAAAGVSRLLHCQIAVLTARGALSIRENGLASADLISQSEIRQLCDLMRQIEPPPPPGQDQPPRRPSARRRR